MIQKNDLFDYGLTIYQNEEYFKFSLDSILLAEFVNIHSNDTVLDVCTGNAPIPMILTTREKNLDIDCLEIQKEIYELAETSIKENGLDDIIHIKNIDAKDYETAKKYDIVTCNPPYFKTTPSSLKNANKVKRIARHEECITLEEVIKIAFANLKETGTFYMVHRVDRLLETIDLIKKYKFGLRKLCFVYTSNQNKPAEFFLLEASKYKKGDPKVYSICTRDRKTYKNIFKEEV